MHPNPDEVADIKYVNREELKELLRKADAGEGGLKLAFSMVQISCGQLLVQVVGPRREGDDPGSC